MICKNCGAELEESSKFCGNCGAKVECDPKPEYIPPVMKFETEAVESKEPVNVSNEQTEAENTVNESQPVFSYIPDEKAEETHEEKTEYIPHIEAEKVNEGPCENHAPEYSQYQNPMQPVGEEINSTLWIILSVLEILFCCLPSGIASLVFSIIASSRKSDGNYQGAAESLKTAKTIFFVGLALGVVFMVISIALFLLGVFELAL